MSTKCQNCNKEKGPGHACPQPEPAVDVDGPPPALNPVFKRQNAVPGYRDPGQLRNWPEGGIDILNRFRRNKSTKKSLRKSKPKKSLRKSKSRKYNRRV